MKEANIKIVYVYIHYKAPISFCEKVWRKYKDKNFLVVNNSSKDLPEHINQIKGSNNIREFSAIKEAVNYFENLSKKPDAYVFINDTTYKNYSLWKSNEVLEFIKFNNSLPILSGFGERGFNLYSDSWFNNVINHIRSDVFAVNRNGASLLLEALDEKHIKNENLLSKKFSELSKSHLREFNQSHQPGKDIAIFYEHLVTYKFFKEGFIFFCMQRKVDKFRHSLMKFIMFLLKTFFKRSV